MHISLKNFFKTKFSKLLNSKKTNYRQLFRNIILLKKASKGTDDSFKFTHYSPAFHGLMKQCLLQKGLRSVYVQLPGRDGIPLNAQQPLVIVFHPEKLREFLSTVYIIEPQKSFMYFNFIIRTKTDLTDVPSQYKIIIVYSNMHINHEEEVTARVISNGRLVINI